MPGTCVVRTLETYADLAQLHQAQPGRYPHLLESVAHGTPQARYDILFAYPGHTLILNATGELYWAGKMCAGDFLTILDRLWGETAAAMTLAEGSIPDVPFRGGWFLYLGYELAQTIEPEVARLVPGDDLPIAMATRFPAAVVRDHLTRRTHIVCESNDPNCIGQMLNDLGVVVDQSAPIEIEVDLHEDPPDQYLEGVRRVLDYIRAGDVFQVNLSRAWQAQLRHPCAPLALYRKLRAANPAPFAGLLTFGQDRAVISSSPERLVESRAGILRTRPIAGTYPRATDDTQDRAWAHELMRNPKERAEHVMLVDLERNDLGRVCRSGSVQVREFMTLESYRHVHHIVSSVEGVARTGLTPGQLIRAVFPGGTITGCPKVRTMQIIAELEQTGRGAYTGSMGYLNHNGDMDLNILIRTLVQQGRRILGRAGAGIVADSDPLRELHETRAKARGMLSALGPGESAP